MARKSEGAASGKDSRSDKKARPSIAEIEARRKRRAAAGRWVAALAAGTAVLYALGFVACLG